MKTQNSGDTNVANAANAARAAWMRTLALSGPDALDTAWDRLLADGAQMPAYRFLRKPESGMTMVRARAGGTGAQFNLGEMSVTRCAVVLDTDGVAGVAYLQGCGGRGARHAERAAVLDALLQLPAWHDRIHASVIAPLDAALAARAAREAAEAARTRVEFFTMARGED
ncbi:phosphonate C-P lyase system protein PhnG [Cupriavidus pauculus]|uniref:Phosphonate C-P lyase system protein PhnG n=1 Tax=Cupriavidus pauculus TaxID=82633 RepID=A0A5P2GZM2_9BURK|nr:phosphonate C-P lyase system protein PhnG [Cupriavidus pauculus]QET00944.1 phosphonate C-P lyase system protein PhnG [Cupriavidus pauculus]